MFASCMCLHPAIPLPWFLLKEDDCPPPRLVQAQLDVQHLSWDPAESGQAVK